MLSTYPPPGVPHPVLASVTAPATSPSAPASPSAAPFTPVFLTSSEERRAAERALDGAGVPLPLHARAAWGEAFPETPTALAALRTPKGSYAAAVGVAMHASHALPGHQLWRVDRVSDTLGVASATQLLRLVAAEARRRMRVLRVDVSVLSRDAEFRAALGGAMQGLRFRRVPADRVYGHTLVLDLSSEDAMLAALSRQTRRNVRAADRQPLAVRSIADPALADRMHDLMRETMARTGGTYTPFDWAGAMRLSAAHPERSRFVGMFRTDADGPESLLAFSWGMHHGDHAVYDAGASTRATDVRIAMAYPLIWDLITWARREGAAWFDFGGVTRPEPGAEDALAGISEFKRNFSRQVEEVGEEFVLDVTPVRSAVARAVGSGVRALRSFAGR